MIMLRSKEEGMVHQLCDLFVHGTYLRQSALMLEEGRNNKEINRGLYGPSSRADDEPWAILALAVKGYKSPNHGKASTSTSKRTLMPVMIIPTRLRHQPHRDEDTVFQSYLTSN